MSRKAPPDLQAMFIAAFQHHQAGRLREAEALYRQVLAIDSRHADSLHLLGVLAVQTGHHGAGADLIGQAIAVNPRIDSYHSNLGVALKGQGRLDEAVTCYRRALDLAPDSPEARFNLGAALQEQGRLDEAAACYRRAVELRPDYPEAHNNLGVVLKDQERLDEAIACLRRALDLAPGYPDAHNNLGIALKKQGRLDEAVACYRRALELNPGHRDAQNNLGNALKDQGRLDEAVACFHRALDLQAGDAEAHNNLGAALEKQGRLDEAVAGYRRALDLRPGYPEAHNNLGVVFEEQGRLDEAVACYHRALELNPNYPEAHNNLGHVRNDQGRLDEALVYLAKAIELRPDYIEACSNRLFAQNYLVNQPPEALREAAEQFGVLASSRVGRAFTHWDQPPSAPPLRVGLVSGDLCNHPVGYFLEALLRAIDPAHVEFVVFSSHYVEDDLTARIKPFIRTWQQIHALNDEAAAHLIHASGVQVLLDLSGHTARNRLPVFAWRPAPVQATWLGYFATTGVAEIDYIIGDPQVSPPAESSHFTEAIWPLPEIYLCFTPPAMAVEVSGLPALSGGGVTFGCFNNLAKINESVVAVWTRVLNAVPGSRLILKARQFRDENVRAAVRARFAAHGLAGDRLLVEPPSPRADYLRAYHRIDIALDPFPYPGGTTSCEALWMGVPVLTKRGTRFLSHAGETIACNAGLPDWIAADDDDYVAKAVRFATDRDALAGLRARLREQVLASPLFDAPRFARNFEHAMWSMWQRWRQGQ